VLWIEITEEGRKAVADCAHQRKVPRFGQPRERTCLALKWRATQSYRAQL
jgi:hypothetical protein